MDPVLAATADFWGDALDLSRVRITNSPWARWTKRAFVTHDTIHWPGPWPPSPQAAHMPTVVHELAHCWQHQTGQRQLTRGLVEQVLFTLFGLWLIRLGREPFYDPYDYGGPAGLAVAQRLTSFRLEAQARIIEDRWRAEVEGHHEIRGDALLDGAGRATAFARDLDRLCRDAGLP